MKVTTKGQVTIPISLRLKYGFLPHSNLVWEPCKEGLILKKQKKNGDRGKGLIGHMTGTASPSLKMSTDEIMELTRGDHG